MSLVIGKEWSVKKEILMVCFGDELKRRKSGAKKTGDRK